MASTTLEIGAVGIRISNSVMRLPEDGVSLRSLPEALKDKNSDAAVIAEMFCAVRSPKLNEILSESVKSISKKRIIGDEISLAVDLGQRLAALKDEDLNQLKLPVPVSEFKTYVRDVNKQLANNLVTEALDIYDSLEKRGASLAPAEARRVQIIHCSFPEWMSLLCNR